MRLAKSAGFDQSPIWHRGNFCKIADGPPLPLLGAGCKPRTKWSTPLANTVMRLYLGLRDNICRSKEGRTGIMRGANKDKADASIPYLHQKELRSSSKSGDKGYWRSI